MIPSLQNHPWLLNVFLILLLHSTAGVGGAKFTIANRCSEPIWPVIQDKATKQTAEYELPISSSVAFQRPSGWNGCVWAKTGCVFNDSGGASSCTTGDTKYVTLAEFSLRSGSELSTDLYDVSLVDGFNLPLLIEPSSRGRCASIGCVEDLNKSCPRELRTQGGAACGGPCAAFGTPEYCCPDGPAGSCRPTNYSRVFKKACPTAYSYVYDDASSLFACTPDVNDDDYVITFCYLLTIPPASNHAYPPHNINPQSRINTSPAYPPHTFNPQQRANGKNHTRAKEIITIVSASIISGAILVSITVICVFHKRRHSRNGPKRKRSRDVENLLAHHGSLAPKRYRYSEIKKITKSLSDKLGQGGFGSVYKGMLADGRLVAVKILTEIDSNGEEFINEVASITRTSHVNIVSLLGFCDEGNNRALVYEFMPNKSLDNFLGNHNGDGGLMDLNKLYEIAVGIAKGLEYLHTGCITRIVHFDIKPQNILLDEDLCPKISDFGLAKLCKKKQSVLSVLGTRGTAGYIAPEVFSRNFGGVSHKSDVYSYGMMLLEMAGARKNVGTVAIQSSENYFPDRIYEKLMIGVTNDDLDDEWMMIGEEEERRRKMMLIGFWCIQTSPSERPSMSKVVEMLEGSLAFIQLPPKPSLCSPVIPDQQNSSSSSSAHVDTDNLASD